MSCSLFKKIGEILVERNLLTKKQVSVILSAQKSKYSDRLFCQIASQLGFIGEDALLHILSELYCIKPVQMEFLYIPQNILNLLPKDIAISTLSVPFYADDFTVKIATTDPGNARNLDRIASAIAAECRDKHIEFFIAKESEILRFLESIKCGPDNDSSSPEDTDNSASTLVMTDPLFVLNKVIFEAIEAKASDIHFEPTENFVEVRFRIDGILQKSTHITFENWSRIKSKLKIISKMDITESRKAQNGHARVYLGGRNIDLRIATVCGSFGENVTIRIFDLSCGVKNLIDLGFTIKDFMWLQNIISHPYGIFLIVGPTGSGKTTTLYSLVEEIKSPTINVVTLEDPIEYQIDGIRQLELREDGLMSFADGIKTILRHDPDVMLVGEIRDEETAAAAIRASLTGRLVLATLHASTPADALRRLVDLGLKLSDFVPSLLGIFSQRLLRYRQKKGRFPVTEYMSFSAEVRRNLLQKEDITSCIPTQTFEDSVKQALEDGITTEAEVRRVFGNGFAPVSS